MSSKAHGTESRVERAAITAVQRGGGYASTTPATGAAEALTLADRVKVDREGGRIHVALARRHVRHFYLGDDEADYLRAQLARLVAPVTVTRVEDRDGAA